MGKDDDYLAAEMERQQRQIYETTIETAPQIVQDILRDLKQESLYLFRTTLTGGYSGQIDDDGSTTTTHIGTPIAYLFHSMQWWSSHEIVKLTAVETRYNYTPGKRSWWPVFQSDKVPIKGSRKKVSGVGVDTPIETRMKRAAAMKANPAEGVKQWRRSEASSKAWATRKQSPKYKAKKKREKESEKKYKTLLKTDPEKAAIFKRRSDAAKKASKKRKK